MSLTYWHINFMKLKYLISKKSLEKALNLNEENFDYILAMGQILDELGDDNSEEYYDKFLVIGDEFGSSTVDVDGAPAA